MRLGADKRTMWRVLPFRYSPAYKLSNESYDMTLHLNRKQLLPRSLLAVACVGGLALFSSKCFAATFRDSFSYSDGLITNEYAHWNPSDPNAKLNNDWEMSSGSFFAQRGTGWTGVPDSCESDPKSATCTNSNIFRLNTKRVFSGNTKVSFAIRYNKDIHNANCESTGTCWYGTHIWLRHVDQFNLYSASIQRADGMVIIKRKVPCGSDNSGTYFPLSSYTPNDWQVGTWKNYSATIANNTDGSVVIKLFDDDRSSTVPVATGVDKGGINPNWISSCTTPGHSTSGAYTPITQGGSVGLRGDYSNFNIGNFTVTTDDVAATEITSPLNGAIVSGSVKVVAKTSDSPVSRVDFYADGALIGTATAAPFATTWNTSNFLQGTHVLTTRAYDAAGTAGLASMPVSITTALVTTTPADTIAPIVALVSPLNNTTATGVVNVVANASDAVGVMKVEFYVNEVLKLSDASAPYSFAWDTAKIANGSYTVRAKAYDAAGNVGVSGAVTVKVANGIPTTSTGLNVSVKVTSEWETGSCTALTIRNVTASPIAWKTSVNVNGTVGSLWDSVATRTGNTLVLSGARWNAVLMPGATVAPGFCLQR